MPSPIKEMRCAVHGPFESRAKDPKCPAGCNTVYWSPRTPPGIRTTTVTKQMDAMQMRVAGELGLSDMRSKYEGESVMGQRRPDQRPQTGPGNPQELMQRVAMGERIGGAWMSPTMLPNAKQFIASQEERAMPTPTAGTRLNGQERAAPVPVTQAIRASNEPSITDIIKSASPGEL